ncbi:hypothetical protein KJI95_03485 [Shewanella sp. JM162201]|uniref:Uncharacterized protein n=1 Tax=Shewanella jiangmenensis TaxID=2837387 RepID=A0ABS5V1T0_9GAMM|nr:hypothetical protein [Shewanella jiangmenensis]MBT1443584.1 hypothetical protein [Shewanella jiangmenensis]
MMKRIHAVRPKFFLPSYQSPETAISEESAGICHPLHFCLTLASFGLWGLVWWYLILRQQGQQANFLAGFDDDYWSYLIEREQPPAALYPQKFSAEQRDIFEA